MGVTLGEKGLYPKIIIMGTFSMMSLWCHMVSLVSGYLVMVNIAEVIVILMEGTHILVEIIISILSLIVPEILMVSYLEKYIKRQCFCQLLWLKGHPPFIAVIIWLKRHPLVIGVIMWLKGRLLVIGVIMWLKGRPPVIGIIIWLKEHP